MVTAVSVIIGLSSALCDWIVPQPGGAWGAAAVPRLQG